VFAAQPRIGKPSGSHRIEGIGFIPLVAAGTRQRDSDSDHKKRGTDGESALAREEDIFAGTSSAANVVVAIRVAGQLGPRAT
jgi:cysteine synthase